MALADDLKSLEELHAKGKLTDQEFGTAKAAAIQNASGSAQSTAAAAAPTTSSPTQPKPEKKSSSFGRLMLLVLLIVLAWIYFQSRIDKPAGTLLKEVTHMPVDLRTETFSVPARSWKAIGIQVPYNGSLTVNVQVLGNGNAMEMFLTNEAGIEKLKSTKEATYLSGFYAVKASTFQHTERISQGSYYFVVRDRHLGILSASASDVSLNARIDP